MPKSLICLCKNKLGGIDSALPILMEVKSLYPATNIAIVFLNDRHLTLIKSNYNLWEALQSMRPSIYVIKGRNKLVTFIKMIRFILRFSFGDHIIMKHTDVLPLHNITMKILKRVSRIKEIKMYLTSQSLDSYKIGRARQVLSRERKGTPIKAKFFNGTYDYFFSTLDARQFKEFFDANAPAPKIVKVGYLRRLPQWREFMQGAIERNKTINNGPYFLYILTSQGRRLNCFEEPEIIELLEESLEILKKYNGKIKTIFKPHATTDLVKVRRLLDRIGYSNYIIDFGHPIVLSSKAKFIFGNFYSTTMFDAYYLGKPTVEYTQYDPEFFKRAGRQSQGGSCCDFFIQRDQKKLDEVLDRLINGNVNITRDPNFIQNNFPDSPQEFYAFWHKLLA